MKKINPKTYRPLGARCLVKVLPVEEKIGSIIKSDITKEADKHAGQYGYMVSAGFLAFKVSVEGKLVDDPDAPSAGDLVHFVKYAGGTFQTGEDGFEYRMVDENDIIGVVERAEKEAKPA